MKGLIAKVSKQSHDFRENNEMQCGYFNMTMGNYFLIWSDGLCGGSKHIFPRRRLFVFKYC